VITIKKKALLITISLILCVILSVYIGFQIKFHNLEVGLEKYLVEKEGIQKSDIESIEAKLSRLPAFPIYLRLKSKPNKVYVYKNYESYWILLSEIEDN
jgi:hypothetical protein